MFPHLLPTIVEMHFDRILRGTLIVVVTVVVGSSFLIDTTFGASEIGRPPIFFLNGCVIQHGRCRRISKYKIEVRAVSEGTLLRKGRFSMA